MLSGKMFFILFDQRSSNDLKDKQTLSLFRKRSFRKSIHCYRTYFQKASFF
jgi:hypothetical protein